jgi:hypothetical protein
LFYSDKIEGEEQEEFNARKNDDRARVHRHNGRCYCDAEFGLRACTFKDRASMQVSVAQLTVTAITATASTIMSLGTVTDTAAEPSLLSEMTEVFAG